jgi:uncharacterized cupin superfamily protein
MKSFVGFDLTKLGAAEESTPAPERIVKGAPQTKTWILDETPDGKQFSGVWECTPGAWRVVYDEWEFCHFLSGVSIITPDGGAPLTVRAGDTYIFRPGFLGHWEVVETTRKLFVARYP